MSKSKLLALLFGLVVSLICSGYIFLLFQNTKLYGNPFGSASYIKAKISLNQLRIHTLRMPFIFIEPLFPNTSFGANSRKRLKSLAIILGATELLAGEQDKYVGTFESKFEVGNNYFGLGGLLWLISIFYSFFYLLKLVKHRGNSNNQQTNQVFLYSAYVGVTAFIIYTHRWVEYGDSPYRFLISSFVVMCAFSFLIEKFIKKIFHYRPLAMICLFFLLLHTYNSLTPYQDSILNTLKQNSETRRTQMQEIRYSPYQSFMTKNDVPSSFLLVGTTDAYTYPLFWVGGKNLNRVAFLQSELKNLNISEIDTIAATQNIEYIIFNFMHSEDTPKFIAAFKRNTQLKINTSVILPDPDFDIYVVRINQLNRSLL